MKTTMTAADGHEFDCFMVQAVGNRKGGLVILQEIFGVTDQLKKVAHRYASEGYEVAIPALFDRQERGAIIPYNQSAKGKDLMLAATLEQTMADIEATVKALAVHGGGVAVMGFCWGGGLAIRTAQTLQIAGAVSFYGTRLTNYLDESLQAPVIGHFGTQDTHVTTEMLSAARAHMPEMDVHMYDADHAFANDARAEHDVEAAELAHERNLAFLLKILG